MSNVTTQWILELVDKVTGPAASITGQFENTTEAVTALTGHIEDLEARQSTLTRKFRNFSIGVAAFGALNYASAQFEESMNRVNTMAGLSQSELMKLKSGVSDLSSEIPILRNEIAGGLYDALSANVPKENILSFIEDSSKAAIAGNADLSTVIKSTSSIIKAYGLDWSKTNLIQEQMIKSVQAGEFTLQEFATAISKPGPLAAQMGVQVNELMASLTSLTAANGNVNEVGTQMKAVFAGVLKPTSEATQMAQKMGVQFDALAIKGAGGLVPFLDNLNAKTQAYATQTGVSANEIYGNLFGSTEAISAIMTLTTSQADKFRKDAADIANSSGQIDEAFNQMVGGAIMRFKMLMNSFGAMMDVIYERISPVVGIVFSLASKVFMLAKRFSEAFPIITDIVVIVGVGAAALYGMALAFFIVKGQLAIYNAMMKKSILLNWDWLKSTAGSISRIIGMGAGYLFAALQGIGTYVTNMITATAAQWGFNIALSANPIGLVIIGLIALIGVVAVVITYWDEITNAIYEYYKIMINIIDFILPGFKNMVQWVMESAGGWIDTVLEKFEAIWAMVKKFFGLDGSSVDVDLNTDSPDGLPFGSDGSSFPGIPFPQNTPLGTGGASALNGANGTGSGGSSNKSLVMNLEMTNNFNVDGSTDVENLADKITRIITDRLQDGVLTVG